MHMVMAKGLIRRFGSIAVGDLTEAMLYVLLSHIAWTSLSR